MKRPEVAATFVVPLINMVPAGYHKPKLLFQRIATMIEAMGSHALTPV